MMCKKWQILVSFCCVTLFSSCVRNQFDLERYEDIIQELSPVEDVDENHDWQLSTTRRLMVDVSGLEDVERIQVLADNPVVDNLATIVGEAYVEDRTSVFMLISYPNLQKTFYAAAIDSEGRYTIVPFDPNASNSVSFENPVASNVKVSGNFQMQSFSYLFEEEYPEAGDYDYNDVVVHLSMRRTAPREVRINVELAAVGATSQLSFAIRLFGYKASDIEKAVAEDNASFDVVSGVEFPDQMRTVVTQKELLLTGLNQEAVLNIFADAHWATGDKLNTDYGLMTRKLYNVTHKNDDTNGSFVPREITYVLTFKDGVDLNLLSLSQLDPFIIKGYNSANWEVHTYAYHNAQVLFSYPGQTITSLPWALSVPNGTFRWPLHAVKLGGRKQGASFGAYPTFDHSFGEWAEDKDDATDWYLYPDNDEVYVK